jgi:hypothetical protein
MEPQLRGGGLYKYQGEKGRLGVDMKHLFIRHIVTTQAYDEATPEERKKYFDEMNKVGKDFGIKLIFWGTPWGVPESLTVVVESDKSLDNLVRFSSAYASRLAQLGLKPFGSAATTVTVTAQE